MLIEHRSLLSWVLERRTRRKTKTMRKIAGR
jgi:hypothetical protein